MEVVKLRIWKPNKGPVLVGWFRTPGNSAVDRVNIPLFLGFYTSQLVQDCFLHQQWFGEGSSSRKVFHQQTSTNEPYARGLFWGKDKHRGVFGWYIFWSKNRGSNSYRFLLKAAGSFKECVYTLVVYDAKEWWISTPQREFGNRVFQLSERFQLPRYYDICDMVR